MQAPDDLADDRHPLGAPIRPAPAGPAEGRWEPVPGAGPHIERHTVTGHWRNVRPTPAPAPVPYPWFGIAPAKPPAP